MTDTATPELSVEERALMVGGIWRTSWGYDQTNVEYFQVVRVTRASIVLRRIGAEVRDGRLWPRGGQWTTDYGLMGNAAPYGERDVERGYSEKLCRVRRHGSYTSARIDDVRTAWPYEGGGAYDTYAAGGAGH